VYVSNKHQSQGIGKHLLSALITESEKAGIWTLQAGIFPENEASIALHKKCGFKVVGLREKLGKMDNAWRDVLLMERRSKVAGM
jgi:phosphinothricin acetyltransferase